VVLAFFLAVLTGGCGREPELFVQAGGVPLQRLDPIVQKWFGESMSRMDAHWDETAGLMGAHGYYPIRENAYYAAGLLFRSASGDVARAEVILGGVLKAQYREPGNDFYGTFRRVPTEQPPPEAKPWRHYDPNWREYVGTTLILILEEFGARLSNERVAAIREAVRVAGAGAFIRNVKPDYTNIAIMSALLLDVAGDWSQEASWRERGDLLSRALYDSFRPHQAFPEYNSPTYYGVDLYGLAMWRRHAASPALAQRGAAMEAALWRDIACFYHAGLKNMCGPYDRAYGMNMQDYDALVGVWIAMVVAERDAPLPDPPLPVFRRRIGAEIDFLTVPMYVIVGGRVPQAITNRLSRFEGTRQVRRTITDSPRREATAWMNERVMIGGEFTSGRSERSFLNQLHPATVHWLTPSGTVGWISLRATAPVDAEARAHELIIRFHGEHDAIFDIAVPDAQVSMIRNGVWRLPGLEITVRTEAAEPKVRLVNGRLEVRYAGSAGRGKAFAFRLGVRENLL
jgi:hypothetical protein